MTTLLAPPTPRPPLSEGDKKRGRMCVVLLTLELIGIWWDLRCPFDIQNADMTDNAEKKRYRGHGNSADKQDDTKLRFML